jgi:hypothetical protein
VLNTSRQIGGSIGLAALATVAVARAHGALAAGHSAADALAAGYDRAFVIAAALCLAGMACSLLIPAAGRPRRDEPPQPAPSAQQNADQGHRG